MKTKQGISLIVLVITIIVMIVLAGAIILSLNNSGIIDKTSDAVEETDLATVKELAQMAWAEAYLQTNKSQGALEDYVLAKLGPTITDKYIIEVTTKGVSVWKQGTWRMDDDGLTVTNGKVTLEIGDSIAYDETNGGTITGLIDTDWRVLGVSDDGELLIMSTSDIVSNYTIGDEDLEECQNDWLTGPTQLNDLCKPYGKGKSATGARSITVEDINKITGYDKTTYGAGKLWEYGNEVTYSSDNVMVNPSYTATNGLRGRLNDSHVNGFNYYNGTDFVVVDLINEKGLITTLKSDFYSYDAEEVETIDKTSKAYTMLFDGAWYWLATPSMQAGIDSADFIMGIVENNNVAGIILWSSNGDCYYDYYGVRAVVSLAADITVTGDSTNGWSY